MTAVTVEAPIHRPRLRIHTLFLLLFPPSLPFVFGFGAAASSPTARLEPRPSTPRHEVGSLVHGDTGTEVRWSRSSG